MHAFPVAVILCIIAVSLTFAGCTSPSAGTGPETDINKTPETDAVAGQPGASTIAMPAILATLEEPTGTRYTNLTRFVEEAAAYAKGHGKDAALREFNNPKGTFTRGELYIFAYDMNGTTLALPYQQGLLGTDRSALSDANGVEFIRGLADVARDGGGSLYYIYPNPEDNNREELKLSSVLPVESGWFVGSGIYLPEVPAVFNTTERDNLVDRVKQARRYAQEQGAKKAIADFNDRNSTFADGSRYIFGYAYNGTTLALPFQPELIGTNRINFSDSYGVRITAWEIAVAKRGGGFVYVNYLNPESGAPGLKLCYVAPADGDWLVGSGIYTRQV
jgi:signal transduction histidine kinase